MERLLRADPLSDVSQQGAHEPPPAGKLSTSTAPLKQPPMTNLPLSDRTCGNKLLEREPTKRMGMATCKAGDIYEQPWFSGLDWASIEQLRVQPPFVPEVVSRQA